MPRLLDSWAMVAHRKNAEAGPEGDQGIADTRWAESSVCPGSLRRTQSRAREDRGARRPATLSGRRSRVPWIAAGRRSEARRPGRGHCGPAGSAADRLAGEGFAAAGEVCRWTVGPGQASLDAAPRRDPAAGLDASGGRWSWLDLETCGGECEVDGRGHRCLDLGTSGVSGGA